MNEAVLLVDVGNTRIKWAVLHDGVMSDVSFAPTRHAHHEVNHDSIRALVESANAFRQQFSVSRAVISSVAGDAVRDTMDHTLAANGLASIEWLVSLPTRCGVINRYRDAAQLGVDRFAALIGAHHLPTLRESAKLVVGAGTAITIDALTREGEFLGGVILPGIATMRQSLNRATAQLPDVGAIHTSNFPRDTEIAISTGTLEAALGAISIRLAQFRREIKTNVTMVLAGGGASMLAEHMASDEHTPIVLQENLVLHGLAKIAAESSA
jgi:type III pantothenate kinase